MWLARQIPGDKLINSKMLDDSRGIANGGKAQPDQRASLVFP